MVSLRDVAASNTTSNCGGAVAGINSTLVLSGVSLHDNSAGEGGAVYVDANSTVAMVSSQLVSNTSSAIFGTGGIYSAGTLTVTSSAILNTLGLSIQNHQ